MFHADFQFSPALRIFGQLKSGSVNGKLQGPDLTDKDEVDFHQAFADLRTLRGIALIRVGRQELNYGSSRLVSLREGPNMRQSFDGVRLAMTRGVNRFDAFATRPVTSEFGAFDNNSNQNQAFWGSYNVLNVGKNMHADFYYLGLDKKLSEFHQGVARERRHTVGARYFGRLSDWTLNLEFAYQFGSFGLTDIAAYTVSVDITYQFKQWRLRPFFNIRSETVSGDKNSEDSKLGTFNPLFPKGSYFGQLALIAPANLNDLHPMVGIYLTEKFELTFDVDFFWRAQTGDAMYRIPYELLRPPEKSDARHIGNQFTIEFEWEISPFISAEGFLTCFQAGAFLQQTGASKNFIFLAPRLTILF